MVRQQKTQFSVISSRLVKLGEKDLVAEMDKAAVATGVSKNQNLVIAAVKGGIQEEDNKILTAENNKAALEGILKSVTIKK